MNRKARYAVVKNKILVGVVIQRVSNLLCSEGNKTLRDDSAGIFSFRNGPGLAYVFCSIVFISVCYVTKKSNPICKMFGRKYYFNSLKYYTPMYWLFDTKGIG